MHERRADGGGIVEMAAWRPFGPLAWPTWWMSEMWVEPERNEVRYRHLRGVGLMRQLGTLALASHDFH